MKKGTFDKPTNRGEYRKGVEGYIFAHPNHPSREFIVARGTKPLRSDDPGGRFSYTKNWYVHDKESGMRVGDSRADTRAEALVRAADRLSKLTPEELAERIRELRVKFCTAVLRSEAA